MELDKTSIICYLWYFNNNCGSVLTFDDLNKKIVELGFKENDIFTLKFEKYSQVFKSSIRLSRKKLKIYAIYDISYIKRFNKPLLRFYKVNQLFGLDEEYFKSLIYDDFRWEILMAKFKCKE